MSGAKRFGRPIEVATPETIEKIHYLVYGDLKLKLRGILEATDVS